MTNFFDAAFDLPGKAGFYLFDNGDDFGGGSEFKDLYGLADPITVENGSLSFADDFGSKNRSRILLDNTTRLNVPNLVPWAGTVISIFKSDFTGGAGTRDYSLILAEGDTTGGVSAIGRLNFQFNSGNVSARIISPSSGCNANFNWTTNAGGHAKSGMITCCMDHANREHKITEDNSTITTDAANASSGSGLDGNAIGLQGNHQMALGRLDNAASPGSATADFFHLAGLIFSTEVLITDHSAKLDALYTAANDYFGL